MKDVYEVLQQKEADAANVRHEIQSLKLVCSLLSGESALDDLRELLRQREADVACVRHEIESLKIVAPLLSEEPASEELTEATGTDGPFTSGIASPRPTLRNLLKRRT